MIRIGIVGLGFMAATHLKAYREVPGARVTALCNPSGRHLDGDFSTVAGNVGSSDPLRIPMDGVTPYREFSQMLRDPAVDAVDICAPTSAHVDLVLAALAAGKHVLCEKPLARDPTAARRILAAAAAAPDRVCMPAMCMRFWPGWTWVREAVRDGRHGQLRSARFRRVAEPPGWGHSHFGVGASSGGALLDLHIHDTDFVQFCLGRPSAVESAGFTGFSGAIDHVVTRYHVASGALVFAEGSWCMEAGFGFHMAYTLVFERATADFDLARGAGALKVFERGQPPRVVACEGPDGYVGELAHFVDAVERGVQPTVVTVSDGAAAVEICAAEEQSIRERRRVDL
jgi:predicted dehydrogenase